MNMIMAMRMNRLNGEQGNRRSVVEIVLSLLLAAAIGLLGYYWLSTERQFERSDLQAPAQFGDPRAKDIDAARLVAAQKNELTWRPLSQDALNRLLVASRLDGQRALEAKVAAAMRPFAWRTASGQMNLITLALENRRFGDVFLHGDALIRRGKATEEVMAVFSLYELSPAQRPLLVAALKDSPPWRQAFLASAERLKTAQQVQARYATITGLLKTGKVGRDELSSLLSRLVATGATEQAYRLWTDAEKPPIKTGAPFDGNFQHAATLQSAGVAAFFPFEWQFESGRNAGGLVTESQGAERLDLYWNGQGVPIFAKQTLRTPPAVYTLTLDGVEASAPARRALGAVLLCPGQEEITLQPIAVRNNQQLAFRADRATRCAYPELRLIGRADRNGADFEMSLTGINLAALN